MADRTTIDALTEALEDEYRARATYRKVIECFGPMQPFVNSSKRKIAMSRRCCASSGAWKRSRRLPATVAQACAEGRYRPRSRTKPSTLACLIW